MAHRAAADSPRAVHGLGQFVVEPLIPADSKLGLWALLRDGNANLTGGQISPAPWSASAGCTIAPSRPRIVAQKTKRLFIMLSYLRPAIASAGLRSGPAANQRSNVLAQL